jgi:hypothetical protein
MHHILAYVKENRKIPGLLPAMPNGYAVASHVVRNVAIL